MPSNPMQRKVRNSFLLGALVMLLVAVLIIALAFFLVIKPRMDKEKEEEQVTAYVYRLRAGANVESGEEITSSMVEVVKIPVTTTATDFIQAKQQTTSGTLIDIPFTEGYKSKLDLTAGTVLTYNMLYADEEIQDSLRYVEYNMITMPTSLYNTDYVDIRLRLSNGQDLIVVSKKQIKNIYGQTVGLNLTEEEIVILNSAIVESYIMKGSELYMAAYVEPGMQEAAVYTYMPTNEVIALINMDENIVNTAKNNLATLYARQGASTVREQVNNATNQYDQTQRQYNIEEGIQAQIEAARKAREDYLSELNGYTE